MIIPESLYELSQRDKQVSWLDPLHVRDSNGFAALTTSTRIILTAPQDRLLIMHNLSAYIFAGGGETIVEITVDIVPPLSVATVLVAAFRPPAVQPGQAALNWTGELIIPPQWGLRVTFQKSAAVALATHLVGVSGLQIPLGNVQRV